jgi:hypothetical protein
MVDPGAAARNFAAAGRGSARSAATASTRRWTTRPSRLPRAKRRDRARLHGAPPGHDGGRHRQHAARRRDARALPSPSRSSRRPSSCCRSARRATWRSPPGPRRPGPRSTRCATELPAVRGCAPPHGATPSTHLLSNGRYTVMVTGAGSGYSRWGDLAVTRWREDVTRDDWGSYVYLRDVRAARSGRPATSRPARDRRPLRGRSFTEDRAELHPPRRRSHSPRRSRSGLAEDDAEVRRVSRLELRQRGARDRGHLLRRARAGRPPPTRPTRPSPSSSCRPNTSTPTGVLLATRRRRSPGEPEIWAAHLAVVEGEAVGEPEIETDRARFLGRGREACARRWPSWTACRSPARSAPCSTRSSRCAAACASAPGRSAHVAFWTMVAASRAEVLDLADKHCDPTAFERAATLAWTQAQVQLRHLGISPEEASLFQRLAGHVLYADPRCARRSDVIAPRRRRPRRSGRTASPATCRSCSCDPRQPRGHGRSCASSCARTSTGG